MYKIIKAVIESKNFELEDILKKINSIWLNGKLNESEYEELLLLARQTALPENSYASVDARINMMFERIKTLESRIASLGNSEPGSDYTDNNVEEYPEYVQPMGAHDAYYAGAKVTYNGVKYICVAPKGVAVVWNPDVMPSYWQEASDEELLI